VIARVCTCVYSRVTPEIVVELSADLALDGLRWRHPVRFVRVRGELTAADLAAEMRAVEGWQLALQTTADQRHSVGR
jgi:hypothetical protein